MTIKTTKNQTQLGKPAVTVSASPQEEEFELENSVGNQPLAFTGVMIAEDTSRIITDEYRSQRWTEIALYRVTQGPNTGIYVLEIVGMSNVYHLTKVKCPGSKYGVVTAPADLHKEAAPCADCHPPKVDDEQPMPPFLAVELDLPQLHECPTPMAVIDKLRERGNGSLSSPAQRIIMAASEHDDGIRDALRTARRI